MTKEREVIGYDDSPDTYDLRVYCVDCGGKCGAGAPPLYAGDEWGAISHPACAHCGRTLDALELIAP